MAMDSLARELLRCLVPRRILEWRKARIRKRIQLRNRGRSSRDIFSEAYEKAEWGGKRGEFYSGRGSDPQVTHAYCEAIRDFLLEHEIGSVLDLGCGDFEVGRRIQYQGVAYTGVDVVPSLIERNRRLYGSDSIRFECLDIVEDALPDAQLCLIRQVFQHLSNQQIAAVLAKLARYAHVIVTEHYPANPEYCPPNLDKPVGPDTRIMDGSGVFLDKAPFSLQSRLLLSSEAPSTVRAGETLRTFLIYPTPSHGQ